MKRLDRLNGAAMIADERKRTVRAAYDALGPRFGGWDEQVEGDPWERFLEELLARLPDGGRVLDLGCGNGVKTARLPGRFDLVAVDFSVEQVRLARARMPEATLVTCDLGELDFAANTGEWLGVEMFFSGFDAETNRRLVREVGFELVLDDLVWIREPQGEVAFLWVLARSPT